MFMYLYVAICLFVVFHPNPELVKRNNQVYLKLIKVKYKSL